MTEPEHPRKPLTYQGIREIFKVHYLRTYEIPTEYALSVPLPTRRWGAAGYAVFAGASRLVPGEQARLAMPDRWWLADARFGGLLVYARSECLPFGKNDGEDWVTLPATNRSLSAVKEDQRMLDALLETAASLFLNGDAVEPAVRTDLRAVLAATVGAPTLPWYRALVPDFFQWLEG